VIRRSQWKWGIAQACWRRCCGPSRDKAGAEGGTGESQPSQPAVDAGGTREENDSRERTVVKLHENVLSETVGLRRGFWSLITLYPQFCKRFQVTPLSCCNLSDRDKELLIQARQNSMNIELLW
jgi:hypothetical protein